MAVSADSYCVCVQLCYSLVTSKPSTVQWEFCQQLSVVILCLNNDKLVGWNGYGVCSNLASSGETPTPSQNHFNHCLLLPLQFLWLTYFWPSQRLIPLSNGWVVINTQLSSFSLRWHPSKVYTYRAFIWRIPLFVVTVETAAPLKTTAKCEQIKWCWMKIVRLLWCRNLYYQKGYCDRILTKEFLGLV